MKCNPLAGQAYRHKRTKVIAICSAADENYALFWVVAGGDLIYMSERMTVEECRECLEEYQAEERKRLNS